jgi:sugar phosphate isomerase/epimerase
MTISKNTGPEVQLGVSPLSWSNDVLEELGGDIPLEVCLKDAAEIGYEGVELGRKFPRTGKVLEQARRNDASFNSAVREGMFTVPGDGDIDFSEFGNFIRSSGYSGWVVVEAEQDPAKAAPRKYTEKAYQYSAFFGFDFAGGASVF